MQIHSYTEHGYISATIDGTLMIIPDDMSNRHRQMIAEWEGEGNIIPPYVHPTPRPIDEIDQDTLNAALAAEGSVVRALALLVLQEINTLRARAGLSTYTVPQLVAALKAKMR